MSNADFMEKLLDGVGVEWKTLSAVVKTVTAPSKLNSQAYRTVGKLPIIDQGIEFIAGYTDEDITPVEVGEYVIFGDHSEHIKYVDFPFIQGADGLKILRPISDNAKYIYHAFLNFYKKELSYKRHWSTAQQTLLPIPCPENPKKSLEIQAEIVRILDAFTALTTELTTELTARKTQYNYYRDQLLSFEEGDAEWVVLSEIATYAKARISAEKVDSKNYVGVDNLLQNRAGKTESNYVPTEGNLIEYKNGDILIGNIRPYLKKIWHADINGGASGDVLVIRLTSESLDSKYLYQVLADDKFFEYNMQHVKGAKMPRGDKGKIMEYRIPVPCAETQARIVAILEKFEALTHSITEGLPREIELRQKQYEYYRDLLLSFPKPEAVDA